MTLTAHELSKPKISHRRHRCWRRGLTLLEVLVVITILALLASLMAMNYRGTLAGAKHKITKQEVAKLKDALEQFYFEAGDYPSQADGLAALMRPVPGQTEAVLNGGKLADPWGRDYVYIYPGAHGKFDLISFGADGIEGGEGENADIVSWDVDKNNRATVAVTDIDFRNR